MSDDPSLLGAANTTQGTLVTVRVIPRASQSSIAGLRRGAVLCRLAAAPVWGAANTALLTLLARTLSVRRRTIRFRTGECSRDKHILIEGLSAAEVVARLFPYPT